VLPPPPPAEEIARRIAAFQAGLQRDGLDAALIVQSADLVYLSGTAQNAHLIVVATSEKSTLSVGYGTSAQAKMATTTRVRPRARVNSQLGELLIAYVCSAGGMLVAPGFPKFVWRTPVRRSF